MIIAARDICFPGGERISLGICVSRVGEHILVGICFSEVGEHVSLERGTHR